MSIDTTHGRERTASDHAGWAYRMGGSALEGLVRLEESGTGSNDPEATLLAQLAELYLCDLQDFLGGHLQPGATIWLPTGAVARDLTSLSRSITTKTAASALAAPDRVWASFWEQVSRTADGARFPAPGTRAGAP